MAESKVLDTKGALSSAQEQTAREEGALSSEKKDGVWVSYYPNGNKQSELTYQNGILEGKAAFYYDDGKTLYKEGAYTNNMMTGDWTVYNRAGVKTAHHIFTEEGDFFCYVLYHENGETAEVAMPREIEDDWRPPENEQEADAEPDSQEEATEPKNQIFRMKVIGKEKGQGGNATDREEEHSGKSLIERLMEKQERARQNEGAKTVETAETVETPPVRAFHGREP